MNERKIINLIEKIDKKVLQNGILSFIHFMK